MRLGRASGHCSFLEQKAMHLKCRRDHLGIPGAKRRRLNEDLEAARVLSSLPFTRQLKRELFTVVCTHNSISGILLTAYFWLIS